VTAHKTRAVNNNQKPHRSASKKRTKIRARFPNIEGERSIPAALPSWFVVAQKRGGVLAATGVARLAVVRKNSIRALLE
jgi:hypothetical protein